MLGENTRMGDSGRVAQNDRARHCDHRCCQTLEEGFNHLVQRNQGNRPVLHQTSPQVWRSAVLRQKEKGIVPGEVVHQKCWRSIQQEGNQTHLWKIARKRNSKKWTTINPGQKIPCRHRPYSRKNFRLCLRTFERTHWSHLGLLCEIPAFQCPQPFPFQLLKSHWKWSHQDVS